MVVAGHDDLRHIHRIHHHHRKKRLAVGRRSRTKVERAVMIYCRSCREIPDFDRDISLNPLG